jgi:hypothetical protein
MPLKSHAQIQCTLGSQDSNCLGLVDKVRSFFNRQDCGHGHHSSTCGQDCQHTNGIFITSWRKDGDVYLFSFPYSFQCLRTEYIYDPFTESEDIGEEF